MAKERKSAQRPLLDAARAHQDTLQAAGLAPTALERYENALRGMAMQAREAQPRAQVLLRDIQREVEEFQAAIRKEFPGDAAVQASFKAKEPVPKGARQVLALGRHGLRPQPDQVRAQRGHRQPPRRALRSAGERAGRRRSGAGPPRHRGGDPLRGPQRIRRQAGAGGVLPLRIGAGGIILSGCPST